MKQGSKVYNNGIEYTVIKSVLYHNDNYLFVIDEDSNIKLFKYTNDLIEILDLDIIKSVIGNM